MASPDADSQAAYNSVSNEFGSITNSGVGLFGNSIGNNATFHINQSPSVLPERPWTVPRQVTSLFTGREQVLSRIATALALDQPNGSAQQQRRVVISGMGGTGKSEVCLKFAHEHRDSFWGVFWIDASSLSSTQATYEAIGSVCGLPRCDTASVKNWLSSTVKTWLLIVDNADDPKHDYSQYFPSGATGNILLTTRNPRFSQWSNAHTEELMQLEPDLAERLLLAASNTSSRDSDSARASARDIVEALGYHTLAILHAGSFINESRIEIQEYMPLYRKNADHLFQSERSREPSAYRTVHATFEVSVERLTSLSSNGSVEATHALELFNLLACLHLQGVFEKLFARVSEIAFNIWMYQYLNKKDKTAKEAKEASVLGLSVEGAMPIERLPKYLPGIGRQKIAWTNACNLLESFSLITIDRQGETAFFTMHPLVQDWARLRLKPAQFQAAWRTAGLTMAVFCESTSESQSADDRLGVLHAKVLLELASSVSISSLTDCIILYQLLQLLARYPNTRRIVNDTVYSTFERLDEYLTSSRKKSHSAYLPGWILRHSSKFKEQTLDSYMIIEVYGCHAGMLMDDDRQQESLLMYKKQLNLAREIDTHVRSLKTHSILRACQWESACAYIDSGDINGGIDMLERLLHSNAYGDSAPYVLHDAQTTVTTNRLAQAYRQKGLIYKSIKLLEPYLPVNIAEEHWTLLGVVLLQDELASTYMSDRQRRPAMLLCEHVQRMAPNVVYDERHALRRSWERHLAQAYAFADEYEEAMEVMQRLVELEASFLPDDDSGLSSSRRYLEALAGLVNGGS